MVVLPTTTGDKDSDDDDIVVGSQVSLRSAPAKKEGKPPSYRSGSNFTCT